MSYHLFEVLGIELEYMLVRKNDLKVAPIVDELMILKNGSITTDYSNGKIEWSNELVAHVLELKTNGPTADLETLDELFSENIVEINYSLDSLNTLLLPTAAHPFMDPNTEMKLWPHNYSKIYSLYNKIFDCRGHGWSNVQSMHINLPFFDDTEFEKLHAAIRLVLPIIPALCASSPILDSKHTGFSDARMNMYKTNQKEIPQMTGMLIPEAVFSKDEYYKEIFEPINAAIKPFDTDGILDHHFLNSRGAIARFDRNAIEIRVIDIQECPLADISCAALIIETLKLLVSEELVSLKDQKKWKEQDLLSIFDNVIIDAEMTTIGSSEYLNLFDIQTSCTAGELWSSILERVKENLSDKHYNTAAEILEIGSLSTRIVKAVNDDYSNENLRRVYYELAACLEANKLFLN